MEWLKILKKPERIDLSNSSIAERVNAPLVLRLKKYKEVSKQVEAIADWEQKHSNKLTVSWRSYIENIKVIPYAEYCSRFYECTLEDVFTSSYKNIFKK